MKMIFICGAPRSGTTLFTELLSGHPDLIVFPGESRIATYWYSLKTNEERNRFFSRDYLNTFEIQILTDKDTKRSHSSYMEKIYNIRKEFKSYFDINAYLNNLNIYYNGPSIINVYYAVACGLSYSKSDRDSTILVVKMPLEHEILAFELSKHNPVFFFHVVRNSIGRCISAKIRNRRRGFIISNSNFAIKHASVSMMSRKLLELNMKYLSSKIYWPIKYSELVGETRAFNMHVITDMIGIDWNDILIEQEGKPVSSHKNFAESKKKDHLSISEKNIIGFFSNSTPLKPSDFIIPYKYENPLHYIRNRKEMLRTMRGNPTVVQMRFYHDMLKRFYNGEDIGD